LALACHVNHINALTDTQGNLPLIGHSLSEVDWSAKPGLFIQPGTQPDRNAMVRDDGLLAGGTPSYKENAGAKHQADILRTLVETT